MKTATVRDLRNNFARVSRWIKDGQKVEITSRGVPLACLVPVAKPEEKKKIRFNAAERMKKLKELYGGKVLAGNGVLLMREDTKW